MVIIKDGPTFNQLHFCTPSLPTRWPHGTHRTDLDTPLAQIIYVRRWFSLNLCLVKKYSMTKKVWESLFQNIVLENRGWLDNLCYNGSCVKRRLGLC
jgi:hypothetical protein